MLIIFGALVLIFSLVYFGRYADKNFKEMVEENKKNNDTLVNTDVNDTRQSSDILEVPLTKVKFIDI